MSEDAKLKREAQVKEVTPEVTPEVSMLSGGEQSSGVATGTETEGMAQRAGRRATDENGF